MGVRQETVAFKGFTFEKDLRDDQRICPRCRGVGLVIQEYPFGLEGEGNGIKGGIVWFNRRYVGFCPDCAFGVQTMCKHCDKPLNRHRLEHDCDGARAERAAREDAKFQEKVAKAIKITEAEAEVAGVTMIYSEGLEKYLSWDELADLDDDEQEGIGVCWATRPTDLSLDADDILESANERLELHEGALDHIGKGAIKELQAFLNTWCETHGRWSRTYHPDYGRVVVVEFPEPESEVVDAASEGE